MGRSVRIVALVLALAPAACSPAPFGVEVSGPLERPVLRLKQQPSLLGPRSVCLREVLVVRDASGWWSAKAQWKVVASDGCVALSQLTYGELVRGLESAAPAEPLLPGVRYRVYGEGSEAQRGGAVIVFEDGAWRIAPDRPPESEST